MLLDAGADLDTALCCAVSHDNEAMTLTLLERQGGVPDGLRDMLVAAGA